MRKIKHDHLQARARADDLNAHPAAPTTSSAADERGDRGDFFIDRWTTADRLAQRFAAAAAAAAYVLRHGRRRRQPHVERRGRRSLRPRPATAALCQMFRRPTRDTSRSGCGACPQLVGRTHSSAILPAHPERLLANTIDATATRGAGCGSERCGCGSEIRDQPVTSIAPTSPFCPRQGDGPAIAACFARAHGLHREAAMLRFISVLDVLFRCLQPRR